MLQLTFVLLAYLFAAAFGAALVKGGWLGEELEYVVSRNAPEEVVVTLQAADDLPIGPDGKRS